MSISSRVAYSLILMLRRAARSRMSLEASTLTPTGAEEGRPVRGCAREASYPSQGSVPWRVLSRKNWSLTKNARRAHGAHSEYPSARPARRTHTVQHIRVRSESCVAMLWRAD